MAAPDVPARPPPREDAGSESESESEELLEILAAQAAAAAAAEPAPRATPKLRLGMKAQIAPAAPAALRIPDLPWRPGADDDNDDDDDDYDDDDGVTRPSPEDEARCAGRVFMTWLTPIVQQGTRRRLELSDAIPLMSADRPLLLWALFQAEWEGGASMSWALVRVFRWRIARSLSLNMVTVLLEVASWM